MPFILMEIRPSSNRDNGNAQSHSTTEAINDSPTVSIIDEDSLAATTEDNETTSTSSQSQSQLPEKLPFPRRIRLLASKITVTIEPMLFFQMTAMSCTNVNIQNLYIRNICQKVYNNTDLCGNMTEDQETRVDAIASSYTTYRNIIECLIPVLFALFLGSWTDKHGCKIPLVLSLTGYTLSALTYTFLSLVPTNVDPNYLLFASLPIAFSGGLIALILSSFKYVASMTTLESRSFRIAIAEGIWFSGVPIGLFYGAKVVKLGGFHTIFITAAVLYAMGCIYVLLMVKEDELATGHRNCGSMIRDMFNIEAFIDTVVTCFRKRSGSKRLWIILLLITICLRILTLFGSMYISYLYTRARFNWGIEEFSMYGIVDALLGVFGGAMMTFIGMKVLKVRDTVIGLISAISYLGGALVWSCAYTGGIMYLGAVVQMFCGMITIVIRSMLSKIVSRDELGKIYSFLACGEATMPLIASPLYNTLFTATVKSFIPAVYLLCAGFNSIIVISFLYFYLSTRNQPFQELGETEGEGSSTSRRASMQAPEVQT